MPFHIVSTVVSVLN